MSRILRFRPRADFDLDELVEYIAIRDERAATRFRNRVEDTLNQIAQLPELSTRFVTTSGREYCIRQVIRYPRYLIIYQLSPTTIDVFRIVRGTRNLEELLDA